MSGHLKTALLVLLACHTFISALVPPGSWQSDDEDYESSGDDVAVSDKTPEIYSLHIASNISYRFATTHVTSQVANRAQTANELTFRVTLPKAAFITAYSMLIDGKVYDGLVKEKEQAKKQYEKAKQKGQSAGKVSAQKSTRDTTTFKVSVNVAAESKVYFNLTYQELLKRRLGAYEHVININPGQVVRDLQVRVHVHESRDITFLKVPPLRTGSLNEIDVAGSNPLAVIDWDGGSNAVITYSPTVQDQTTASQDGVAGQFVVQYDVQRDLDAGELQVVDGYFVHYFAPSGLDPVPKNVLFILDVSGSMSGEKIEQTKEAMDTILTDLAPEDMFNIILFESEIRYWSDQQQLVPATLQNVNRAKHFIRGMHAGGGTNMNDALLTGIKYLKDQQRGQEETRASLILFLTDGQPTGVGTEAIIRNVHSANDDEVTLFSLGFGQGVDFPFLKKMSLQNRGLARRIYADSDASLQLQGFYKEVSTPLLSDVNFTYLGDVVDEESLTASDFRTFFQGSELIVAGKLKNNNVNNILTQINAESSTGSLNLGIEVDVSEAEDSLRRASLSNFTERLWAYLTIKKLLDRMTEATDPLMKEAAKQQALDLSLKYSFVTPLTSMVVTKPDSPPEEIDESVLDLEEEEEEAREMNFNSLDKTFSIEHTEVRKYRPIRPPTPWRPGSHLKFKKSKPRRRGPHSSNFAVDSDPHFIVKMKGLDEGVCFDVQGKSGDVYQLVHDWRNGITVHGQMVSNNITRSGVKDADNVKTYIGQVAITRKGTVVKITPSKITVDGKVLQWHENNTVVTENLMVKIHCQKNVVIDMGIDVVFMVLRHKRKVPVPGKVDFLGFYIRNGKGLSHSVHGLIGQFQHRSVLVVHVDYPGTAEGQAVATLRVKGAHWAGERLVEARLSQRRNMEISAKVPCWFVRNTGRKLLDGHHADYRVPKLTTTRFALSKYPSAGRKVARILAGTV